MRVVKRSSLVMAALLLVAAPMMAQVLGTLTGTARTDGTPLPGVTVTISSPALQGTRTTYTDVNGNYNFGALPPGVYTVVFEMESMQPVTSTTRVTLGGSARAGASMRLSALEEAITVTASVPGALETTEVQTNFQADMIADLPIGRTLQATTTLAPGVNTNGPNPGAITISGALAADNLFMVNGAVTNENIRGQSHNLFIEDAIQETTVQTAAISAEYGRFLGGVVNAITRSGGNEFSGSLRNSLTNPDWTAKTPLPGQPDPLDNLNEVYAATLGGRIIRDRLWFFGAGRFFESDTEIFLTESTIPFTRGQEEHRYEAKLTGQITDRHNLVASYLKVQADITNGCFISCFEFSNLDPSLSLPNDFLVLRYNGILSDRLLLEGSYTQKNFAFEDSGGDFRDRERGTWGFDMNTWGYFGAPAFCGVCDPEERNNSTYGVKGTYYLATEALGTHNIVAGYENWAEERIVNNYQSGSDFGFIVFNSPERAADGTILPIIAPGDQIGYFPILQLTQGSDFQTDSIYINDKWDLNHNLQLSLGVRYDVNDGKDSAGNAVVDDSIVSPRLGVMYDVKGDGRVRFNASYSKYVNRIAENIGNSSSPGGSPAYFYYLYEGPLISGVDSVEAFRRAFAWFDSVGGLSPDSDARLVDAGVPGVSLRITDELISPNVDGIVFGMGAQLGRNGFARLDFITRDFKDFFITRRDLSTGIVTDPFGSEFDLGFVENSNVLERTYDAVQLQGAWRFSDRLNAGANYTWSETKGNQVGQTGAGGPIADEILSYPEFKGFAQHNPAGFLPQDQTHKVRAWVSFDQPTPIGDFNISLLQNFDSGTPYSAIGTINTGPFVPQAISDQYATPPTSVTYYFSDRGEFRWDDITSTDLALNYRLPIRNVGLFLQAQLLNAFNEDGQVSGNTNVLTHRPGSALSNFNPFTEQPVEGVNFRLGPNFGRPTAVTHYQRPRTYQFSVGMRF